MLFPSDWTVVRAPKTKGAAGIRYTLHAALRKQDFKARQNFFAHFRNHGRFLSSTSQKKHDTRGRLGSDGQIDERGGDRLGGRERRAEAELLFDGGDLVANRWHQVTMLTSAPSCEAELANLTWCGLAPPRLSAAPSSGVLPRSGRFLSLGAALRAAYFLNVTFS